MCPPGVDQTTRGPQNWTILTPLLEELCDASIDNKTHRQLRPANFILGDFTWDAFSKLVHYGSNKLDTQSRPSSLPVCPNSGKASTLERMPPELLSMVMSQPSLQPQDLVAFGLSSQTLWVHLLGHVRKKAKRGPWVGTPLLCTGSYLMSVPPTIHDICPNMKSEEEEFFNRPGRGPRGNPTRGMCPARRWNWNAVSTYLNLSEQDHQKVWLESFNNLGGSSGIPKYCQVVLRRSLEAVLFVKRSSLGRHWVLRNFTTKEYVVLRSSQVHGRQEHYVHVKGVPWLSVDKALLLRICWSTGDEFDAESRATINDGLMRGRWAGHCFDIVSGNGLALHRDWHNVTKEIVEDGKAIKDRSSA